MRFLKIDFDDNVCLISKDSILGYEWNFNNKLFTINTTTKPYIFDCSQFGDGFNIALGSPFDSNDKEEWDTSKLENVSEFLFVDCAKVGKYCGCKVIEGNKTKTYILGTNNKESIQKIRERIEVISKLTDDEIERISNE